MIRVLIIDNSDSFTYNLVETFRQLDNCSVNVVYLEQLSVEQMDNYDAFVLSPGPGLPSERKTMNQVIKTIIDAKKPLLGVCLGHQAIVEYYSGSIKQLNRIIHGESSLIHKLDDVIYDNLPRQIEVGRYHSWAVNKDTLPKFLNITSETENGIIMSFKHMDLNVRGVQFHPESILTIHGSKILENWLTFCVVGK